MKFVKRNYNIKSNKIAKPIKLFGITDLHYTFYTKSKKLDALYKEIKKEEPDFVVFTGDLIDHTKRINDECMKKLYDFFKKLCGDFKVIFIKGNHDTMDEFNELYDLTSFFKSLCKLDNFNYLDGSKNKSFRVDNICFYGFELHNDYYYESKENNTYKLVKGLKNILKNIDKEKYNILLFHSPTELLKKNVIDSIKNVDLILCGHMHNGLIIDKLDNRKSNMGLLSPRRKLFPKFSRNMIDFSEMKAIVMYPLSFLYKVERFGFEFLFTPGYQVIKIS